MCQPRSARRLATPVPTCPPILAWAGARSQLALKDSNVNKKLLILLKKLVKVAGRLDTVIRENVPRLLRHVDTIRKLHANLSTVRVKLQCLAKCNQAVSLDAVASDHQGTISKLFDGHCFSFVLRVCAAPLLYTGLFLFASYLRRFLLLHPCDGHERFVPIRHSAR